MKPVRLSAHAAEQALHRGATTVEIVEAIQRTEWSPAAFGRLQASRQFTFGEEWNGKRHALKLVRPIFIAGPEEILVVTVYVHHCDEETP
ncbi:MAG: hypothetical protein WCP21_11060 [Armatimonadota bacterium]